MSKRPEWWLAVLAKIWPITWISARATGWPVVGWFVKKASLPLFSGKNLNITYLPINEEIKGASTLLPGRVVEEFINRSSHRVIINKCTCRDARQCKNHPVEYGCTLLGEGTREIDERIARHVTKDEAIAHLHKTIEDGLVPMIGRVKIDNLIWGVPDKGKLLTICHCCHCCCTILTSGRYIPREMAEALVPLKGLQVVVDTESCNLCGTCVENCHMSAISIDEDRIVHNMSRCIGCGRCVTVCPQKAVNADVEDIDEAIEELTGRMGELVDIQ
ncbi:MAG: 4Fe-4S binding protein [Deltaproteobacteria bacterium]|nr:4Fe-4S binding protein [Deltaproteobacteria bacterium]MBW2596347.1 4Fe-4S binding protein [Deltaproteobacteria bacterium]MBW2650667.1 4Fe-4S binding protein [Deltaproteobacteria bacterium]